MALIIRFSRCCRNTNQIYMHTHTHRQIYQIMCRLRSSFRWNFSLTYHNINAYSRGITLSVSQSCMPFSLLCIVIVAIDAMLLHMAVGMSCFKFQAVRSLISANPFPSTLLKFANVCFCFAKLLIRRILVCQHSPIQNPPHALYTKYYRRPPTKIPRH